MCDVSWFQHTAPLRHNEDLQQQTVQKLTRILPLATFAIQHSCLTKPLLRRNQKVSCSSKQKCYPTGTNFPPSTTQGAFRNSLWGPNTTRSMCVFGEAKCAPLPVISERSLLDRFPSELPNALGSGTPFLGHSETLNGTLRFLMVGVKQGMLRACFRMHPRYGYVILGLSSSSTVLGLGFVK